MASSRSMKQQRIGAKISVLEHEHIPHKQAIAMAINMEREHRLGPNGQYIRKGNKA